ncbi:MAG: two pore domain potassium channel family protein [Candidatus Peribacteraceae bacterium]|nr:two pore domain potassium channel family protein [Candidatus Peribacteraceae bacterium]
MTLFFKLIQRYKTNRIISNLCNIISLFFLFFIAHFIGFHFFENVSWNESFWQTWQTFTTVGYGNRPAETVGGRWITMLFGTMGIAYLGVLFSAYFDYKQYKREMKRSGRMKNPYKGYVLFNMPEIHTLRTLINEIRHDDPDVGICIVDDRIDALPTELDSMKKVRFVRGSVLSKQTYELAGVAESIAVVVFPTDSTNSSADGITKTTVDLLERFIGNGTRIIHVIVDPQNEWLFEDTKSTPILECIETLMIAQECKNPHSSEAVAKLFRNSEGAVPFTTALSIEVESWELFEQVCMAAEKDINIDINPFALIKAGQTFANPKKGMSIGKGDKVCIIVNPDFKWEPFNISFIQNYRKLKGKTTLI